MGNNISNPQPAITEADVLDYVTTNPDIFLELSGEFEEYGKRR